MTNLHISSNHSKNSPCPKQLIINSNSTVLWVDAVLPNFNYMIKSVNLVGRYKLDVLQWGATDRLELEF